MAKYELTNEAVEDLGKIWDYTFDNWSEKQADSYYEMLLENCIFDCCSSQNRTDSNENFV